MGVSEILDVAVRGMTLIYGPPGSGKTSLALRVAGSMANKTLWISTAEGPDLLKEAAKRLAVDPSKFDFLDFPRAFQKDIARYILDHASSYDAVVIDSVEGVAGRQNIDVVTHSVLYQVAKEKPVILVAEEETPRIAYVADHVIHVWYRINSLGHIIRYIQLEKSRTRPPSPRYLFDIIEGAGIMYIYPTPTRGKGEVVEDEKLGITAPRRSTICIHSEKVKNVTSLLSKIKDRSIFLQVSYWTSFHGLEIKEEQIHVVKIFHDIYKFIYDLATNGPKASYLVVGGLLNMPEEDRREYLIPLGIALNFVDFLLLVDVGSKEETDRLKKYCDDIIEV